MEKLVGLAIACLFFSLGTALANDPSQDLMKRYGLNDEDNNVTINVIHNLAGPDHPLVKNKKVLVIFVPLKAVAEHRYLGLWRLPPRLEDDGDTKKTVVLDAKRPIDTNAARYFCVVKVIRRGPNNGFPATAPSETWNAINFEEIECLK